MITFSPPKKLRWTFRSMLFFVLLFLSVSAIGQTTIWSENWTATGNCNEIGCTAASWNYVDLGAACTGTTTRNVWMVNTGGYVINTATLQVGNRTSCGTGTLGAGYINRATDIIYYRSVNATGYTSVTLDFKWRCAGQSGADYGKVCYSTDGGTTWVNLATNYSGQATTQTVTGLALPAALAGTTFMLGYRYICNALTLAQPGFCVDDIVVKGISPSCTITGNNFCSGAGTPLLDGTCCASTLSGATDDWAGLVGCQSGNHPEVWFTGTAAAGQNQFQFVVDNLGAGFGGNVELIVVSATGSCSGLTIVGSSCGPAPLSYNLVVVPGTTYYWTVSSSAGSNSATSTFSICVTNNVYVDNSACNINDVLTATPAPTVNVNYPLGTYPPGTTVQFDYTITGWDIGASCNWLAAIVPSWGSGWDPASFVRTLNPVPAAGDTGDSWGWWTLSPITHNVSGANINPNGGAWIYCNDNPGAFCSGVNTDIDWGDGCIGDAWGHFGCTSGCDAAAYAALTWNVGFQLTTWPTAAACAANSSDLSVSVKTYADGEIGSWTSIGCMADVAATNGSVQACCVDATTPLTWTGYSTSWINTDNWGSCIIPTCTNDITIASTASNATISTTAYCKNLTINAGATLVLNAGSILYICGNFINNGTLSAAAGSTVVFVGTAAQSISGSTTSTFANLTINNTSATGVTLSTPANVSGALTLTDGIVYTTATNILTILNGATSTPGSAVSFVDGWMRKIGNQAFVFPLGDGIYWARLGISAPSLATDAFTATYNAAAPSPSTPVILPNIYVSYVEHWICNRTAGTSNVFVTLFWEDGSRSGINTFSSDLHVARWDGAAWQDHGSGTLTGSAAAGSLRTSAAVTSFSPFTFASISASFAINPLPIELLNFSAYYTGKSVDIQWTTATEVNNNYFNVERSTDGFQFTSIGQIPSKAPGGNSSSALQYYLNDRDVKEGVYYYRLKQTDRNNGSSYSEIATVTVSPADNSAFVLKPNPTETTADLIYYCSGSENPTISIYDSRGRLIASEVISCTKGENIFTIDLSGQTNGLFYVTLATQSNVHTSKLIKNSNK